MEELISMLNFFAKNGHNDYGKSLSEELTGLIRVGFPSIVTSEEVEFHLRRNYNVNLMIKGWKRIFKSLERIHEKHSLDLLSVSFETEKYGYMGITDLKIEKYIGLLRYEDKKIVYENQLSKDGELLDEWSRDLLFLNKKYIPNERHFYYIKKKNLIELERYNHPIPKSNK